MVLLAQSKWICGGIYLVPTQAVGFLSPSNARQTAGLRIKSAFFVLSERAEVCTIGAPKWLSRVVRDPQLVKGKDEASERTGNP